MYIKKLNISFDPVTGKILFDIDVDGISCRGSVDTSSVTANAATPSPQGEGLNELLYLIEEGCQKIRRKIGEKEFGIRSAECGIKEDFPRKFSSRRSK